MLVVKLFREENMKLQDTRFTYSCTSCCSQEKSQEYDELKCRLQEQLTQARANSSKELHELRVQLASVTEQLAGANSNANRKEEEALQLKYALLLSMRSDTGVARARASQFLITKDPGTHYFPCLLCYQRTGAIATAAGV